MREPGKTERPPAVSPVAARSRVLLRRRQRLVLGSLVLVLLLGGGGALYWTKLKNPPATDSVAFSPDGQLLAAASTDQTVRVWSVSSGSLLHTFANPGDVVPEGPAVAFSPDGQLLAAAANSYDGRPEGNPLGLGTVRLWDVKSGKLVQTLHPQTPVFSLAFSPTDHTLAVGAAPMGFIPPNGYYVHVVELWDVRSGQLLRSIDSWDYEADTLVFSPDGRTVAVSSGQRVILLDVASGRPLQVVSDGSNAQAMAWSSDGRMLAIATWHDNSPDPSSFTGEGFSRITLWEVASGTLLRTLVRQAGAFASVVFWSLAFSPDGQMLAAGSATHQITLWEVARGARLRTLSGHSSDVFAVAFSPDGRTLASGSKDLSWMLWANQTVKLWDVQTGSDVRTLSG